MQGTIQGIAPKTISGCLSRNLVSQKRVGRYIQSTERKKKCQTRILYLAKLYFKNKKGGAKMAE